MGSEVYPESHDFDRDYGPTFPPGERHLADGFSRRLALFAKHWTPGRAKTRLAATIGDSAAAEAAKEFLTVTMRRFATIPCAPLLAYTPIERRDAFSELADAVGGNWRVEPQPDVPSLGERMAWLFRSSSEEGFGAAVIVGSDSPDMPLAAVNRAFAWLEESGPPDRVVFGPTQDGGYWLIGARGNPDLVLGDMPWSRADLMDETLKTLDRAGWKQGQEFELVEEWYDVDTGDDLSALCERIELAPDPEASLQSLAEKGRQWLSAPLGEN